MPWCSLSEIAAVNRQEFISERLAEALSDALAAIEPVTPEITVSFAAAALASFCGRGMIGMYKDMHCNDRPIMPAHDFHLQWHEGKTFDLHFRWFDAAGNPHIGFVSQRISGTPG